jgi:hypothetical protein
MGWEIELDDHRANKHRSVESLVFVGGGWTRVGPLLDHCWTSVPPTEISLKSKNEEPTCRQNVPAPLV